VRLLVFVVPMLPLATRFHAYVKRGKTNDLLLVYMIKEASLELETCESNILLNRRFMNLDLKECDIDRRNSSHTVCLSISKQYPTEKHLNSIIFVGSISHLYITMSILDVSASAELKN